MAAVASCTGLSVAPKCVHVLNEGKRTGAGSHLLPTHPEQRLPVYLRVANREVLCTLSCQHSRVARQTRCKAAPSDNSPSEAAAPARSLLCQNCDGNGAVECGQCKGTGVNQEDKFDGRFKAGQTCWLCRGKRQMLCGECNGAGFLGGFMSTQSD